MGISVEESLARMIEVHQNMDQALMADYEAKLAAIREHHELLGAQAAEVMTKRVKEHLFVVPGREPETEFWFLKEIQIENGAQRGVLDQVLMIEAGEHIGNKGVQMVRIVANRGDSDRVVVEAEIEGKRRLVGLQVDKKLQVSYPEVRKHVDEKLAQQRSAPAVTEE
jgi:hypothetical protein